jgi:hypothetical protein
MVPYSLEQRVFLYDTYVKYGSAEKCRRKFRRKFHDKRVPSRQTTNNLVNKLRSTGLLIDKKQKHKRQVLSEKLHDIGSRLEHTPRKSRKRRAQETAVSESSARRATQLLKLRPYKTTIIHVLQPLSPQLTFFSDEASIHLQGYINTQNNRYWSSQTPHLIHDVSLHPVKVGVWCAVKCKKHCCTCVLLRNNCERYLRVEGHADSLAKSVCASRQAAPRSPWSAEPWNRSTKSKSSLCV